MRKITIVTAVLLGCAVPPAQAAMGGGVHRFGPTDSSQATQRFVCKIIPRDGGGFCTTVPYAHLGVACTCDGGRHGVVSTR
jgi:hypothetical protein